jgi:hypothetical protein
VVPVCGMVGSPVARRHSPIMVNVWFPRVAAEADGHRFGPQNWR